MPIQGLFRDRFIVDRDRWSRTIRGGLSLASDFSFAGGHWGRAGVVKAVRLGATVIVGAGLVTSSETEKRGANRLNGELSPGGSTSFKRTRKYRTRSICGQAHLQKMRSIETTSPMSKVAWRVICEIQAHQLRANWFNQSVIVPLLCLTVLLEQLSQLFLLRVGQALVVEDKVHHGTESPVKGLLNDG